ncbi:MAG: glycosyltransferase family 9 protein [Acidobacteriaceae bacterium]
MGKTKAGRVLIYRLGSLGDMLVALPALHLVERAFPESERRMLTNFPVSTKAPAAAEILEGTGLVQGYLRYSAGTRSAWELLGLWWTIVRWRPQVLVYLAGARGVKAAQRDELFFRVCGVRRIVGVPLTEGMQRNYYGAATGGKDHAMGDGNLEPEAARLVRCIGELGAVEDIADPGRLRDAASWDLHLSAEERARAAEVIAAVGGEAAVNMEAIAVCVGTKVQAKDWGRENWRGLLGRMAAEAPGRALLMLGAAEESEASEFAAEGWTASGGGAVVNLCGKLTPRESAAAIARAQLFVGHDSGPMHLAASVGTPIVAIFAARNIPRQWFPFGKQHRVVYHRVECWGCGLETCIEQQKKCLMSITVDEVMGVVRSQLSVLSEGSDH